MQKKILFQLWRTETERLEGNRSNYAIDIAHYYKNDCKRPAFLSVLFAPLRYYKTAALVQDVSFSKPVPSPVGVTTGHCLILINT